MTDDPTPDAISRRAALARVAALLGGALSATAVAGVLAGCDSPGRRDGSARGAYRLRALTGAQNALVIAVAERIVPETSTPGATTARVNEFIDTMLAEYYPADERALFLAGLADLDERARRAHGRSFVECAPAEQLGVLVAIDTEAYAPPATAAPRPADTANPDERTLPGAGETPLPPEVEADTIRWSWGERRAAPQPGRAFWRTMKELTLLGYYTSEPGATQELRYAASPGRFEGCVPLERVGRAWAT